MNRFMVLLREIDGKPETIAADKYSVQDGILSFWRGEALAATFISWVGVKEIPNFIFENPKHLPR